MSELNAPKNPANFLNFIAGNTGTRNGAIHIPVSCSCSLAFLLKNAAKKLQAWQIFVSEL
jgi:hypothetical protein